MDKLYSLRVLDYSAPGFISSTNRYYGTEQAIINLLEFPIKHDNSNEVNQEMLKVAQDYFHQQAESNFSLFGEEAKPILEEVEIIGEAEYHKDSVRFNFYNTWDCLTKLKIKHIDVKLLYIRDTDKKYKRCIQVTVDHASYKGFNGGDIVYGEEFSLCWGLPGFILPAKPGELTGSILTNSLYYVDKRFKSKQAATKDMEHPSKPNLRNFFLEIHGNG